MGMRRFSEKMDIISNLPQNLIDTIITKLPIRDAVRTSILSSKWRYQWANMTQLVFNYECVHPPYTQDKLMSFMIPCLFLHQGPIHKFKLSAPRVVGNFSPGIDQCLLFLSRKDIKELDLHLVMVSALVFGLPVLIGNLPPAPSSIFSCQQLTSLTLCQFVVKPPPKFRGFPCVKYLKLDHCSVTLKVIENLISGCPPLESFEFIYIDDQLALTVNAPNLKHLTVAGTFTDIYLKHTPLLAAMSVTIFSQAWKGDVFVKLPTTYNYLKFIKVNGVSYQEMNEVLYVHHLLLQSPNLENLQISAELVGYAQLDAAGLDLWDKEDLADFKFQHLKSVKMWYVSNEYDKKFIKFVLGRSPVLQMMSISLDEGCNGIINMVNEVLHFRRASPDVDIIFDD